MKRRAAVLVLLFAAAAGFSQEPDAGGIDIGGSLRGSWGLLGPREGSALYLLQYAGRDPAALLSDFGLVLRLNGDYSGGDIGAHVHTAALTNGTDGIDFILLSLYGEYYASPSLLFLLGKKAFSWGKGYAFSVVNFAALPKDPADPELALEGTPALGGELTIAPGSDVLGVFSLGLYALPSFASALPTADDILNTFLAGRLSVLFLDTDVDLMAHYGRNNPLRVGADLSRNLFPELEVHGEISYSFDRRKYTMAGTALQTVLIDEFSFLTGLRWLSPWNMTTVFEYYHNGAGLSRDEFIAYNGYLSDTAAAGIPDDIAQALGINRHYFRMAGLMTDYLYVKITQPEPLGLVDVSLSLFALFNLVDYSVQAAASVGLKPVTNLELTVQANFFLGAPDSEFGSKPYVYTVVLAGTFSF